MLSIIIPIYNKEKTLGRCIESILGNKFNECEIILVNDGSKDSSGIICDEYSNKYDFITAIHTKNKGVSSARNNGLSIANGEYITFIDADDYIDNNFITLMMKNKQYDLVICGYKKGKSIYLPGSKIEKDCKNAIIEKDKIDYNKIPWGKLYKASIIKKNNLRFDESMNYGEDYKFVIEYSKKCSNIKYIDNALYNAVDMPNSLSKTTKMITECMEKLYNVIKSEKDILEINKKYFQFFCFKTIAYYYRKSGYKTWKANIDRILLLGNFKDENLYKKLTISEKIRYILLVNKRFYFLHLLYLIV